MIERAWRWREERGILVSQEAVRIFHGPGEGEGAWSNLAVDRFGENFWITRWEAGLKGVPKGDNVLAQIIEFLASKRVRSIVTLERPRQGVPEEPKILYGQPPEEAFEVSEGTTARFRVRVLGARHPGLFLDHAPLRAWLMSRSREWSVLNTFAYTGSLSVAAGLGGAAHVTTLDLSKPTIAWASENWKLNGLAPDKARFISGDVFEWLPRLRREKQAYDCVILDPPSFSRGSKGNFSTSKDLQALHELALDVLAPGGVLITSINSASVSWGKYQADLLAAIRARKRSIPTELGKIDLPDTFPSHFGDPEARYLKGWILRFDEG